jgi:hypothetical protein
MTWAMLSYVRSCPSDRFDLPRHFLGGPQAVQGLLHDFKDLLGDVFVLGVGDRHVISPSLSEPATIAVSMAIDRPQAIDDAPVGPERSGGWRR